MSLFWQDQRHKEVKNYRVWEGKGEERPGDLESPKVCFFTRRVVDAYYRGMPDAIGFVNGYAPAYTFAVQNGKPLISYDYHLSPTRPETTVWQIWKSLSRSTGSGLTSCFFGKISVGKTAHKGRRLGQFHKRRSAVSF